MEIMETYTIHHYSYCCSFQIGLQSDLIKLLPLYYEKFIQKEAHH